MNSKADKDRAKQLQDKCQSVLTALLRDEDNKYCVDCDSKGPRWASWNIGVFLCIRCAGIHRNLGVHISKVKSVNLDSWTPEQVVSLQQMGNSRARAVYEANLPDNFRRPQNDSSLESFIRAKYEHKKYIAREWVPPTLPKVNWEKEIDEEIEKQKKKKKTMLEKKSLPNVEVPQLPKPTNPSPKPARSTGNTSETKKVQKTSSKGAKTNGANADLLGLQNGEDNFSSFISSTPASNTVATQQAETKKAEDSAKSEEESFFNQTMPTEKEKVKLDKDSILALYASAPPNNFNQFPNVINQAPYAQANIAGFPVQGNFQAFGGFPQQPAVQAFPTHNGAFPVQNGLASSNLTQPNLTQSSQAPFGTQQSQWGAAQWSKQGNAQFPAQKQLQMPLSNQFPAQFPSSTQQFATNFPVAGSQQVPLGQINKFAQSGNSDGFVASGNTALGNAALGQMPNPFFGTQSAVPATGLQQQFGNLSLNGAVSNAPSNANMTTNIWQ